MATKSDKAATGALVAPFHKRSAFVLLVALALGAALRIVGLNWGLPTGLHPDEYVVVNGAIDLIQRNSWIPQYFYRPDHIEIYLARLLDEAYSRLVLGQPPLSVASDNPGLFTLLARCNTVLFGVLGIWAAYLVGKLKSGFLAGVLALLFAVTPMLVQHSHYATPDVPQATMFTFAIYGCVRYLREPKFRWIFLMTAASAVATGIKYPGALANLLCASAIIYVAVKSGKKSSILVHGAAALASYFAVLAAVAPALFIETSKVVEQIVAQGTVSNDVGSGLGYLDTIAFYFSGFGENVGLIFAALTVLGIWTALKSHSEWRIPTLFGVVYLLIMSAIPLHWNRWLIPALPSLLLACGLAIEQVAKRMGLHPRSDERKPSKVVFALGLLAFANLFVTSITEDVRFSAPDTRITSVPAVAKTGATKDNTVFEGFSTLQPTYPKTVFGRFSNFDTDPTLVDTTKRFLLTSGCTSGTYSNALRFPRESKFYTAVDSKFKLIWQQEKSVGQLSNYLVEPMNIISRLAEAGTLIAGGQTGCDLKLYDLSVILKGQK